MKIKKNLHSHRKRGTLNFRIIPEHTKPDSRPEGRLKWGETSKAVIFKSEMDFICKCILERPSIETGGQLFGYYTASGEPIVMYAIGPGPKANHQVAFFNQDIDYLRKEGRELKSRFGIHHIGEWHSHHQLGLAHPSGHDASNMVTTIREKGLGHFLLCIGNCDGHNATINPFHCDGNGYSIGEWDVIPFESPIRRIAESSVSENSEGTVSDHKEAEKNGRPQYPEGYWLTEKSAAQVLNRIYLDILKPSPLRDEVNISIDEKGLVHIFSRSFSNNGCRLVEDILFPRTFPNDPPKVNRWFGGELIPNKPVTWVFTGDIYKSFETYYSKL